MRKIFEIYLVEKTDFGFGVVMVIGWFAVIRTEWVRMRYHYSVCIEMGVFVLNAVLNDKKKYRQNENKQKFYIFPDKNHANKYS